MFALTTRYYSTNSGQETEVDMNILKWYIKGCKVMIDL